MASARLRALDPRPLLAFGTLVALVATAGSLYLSLGMGLLPCRLCWYQRILMYPLVVVLGVAALDRDVAVVRTALPLSVLGLAVATYHSFLQVAAGPSQCLAGGCGTVQFRVLGLTVPNLSLTAFLLVTGTLLLVRRG
jgi:disulfide bond formation protein DsbB